MCYTVNEKGARDGRLHYADEPDFTEYLRFTQRESYAPEGLTVIRFSGVLTEPIGDDEYTELIKSAREDIL